VPWGKGLSHDGDVAALVVTLGVCQCHGRRACHTMVMWQHLLSLWESVSAMGEGPVTRNILQTLYQVVRSKVLQRTFISVNLIYIFTTLAIGMFGTMLQIDRNFIDTDEFLLADVRMDDHRHFLFAIS